jgi:hypothetical protein
LAFVVSWSGKFGNLIIWKFQISEAGGRERGGGGREGEEREGEEKEE